MSEKKEVFKQEVKHKGLFHYSDLYNFCYNWLKDEGYLVSEEKYIEKVSGAKEVQIEWKASKKISDYYQYVIELKWHILGMTDAEAEENGKKIKTNKGEVKIKFVGTLVRDYEDNWDKDPAWKFLRGIYDKYIIRTTTDENEDKLFAKVESLVEEVKAFLNLEGRR